MRTHHPGRTPAADQPGRTVTPAAVFRTAISRSAVGDVAGVRGQPLAAPVTEGMRARLAGDFSRIPAHSGSAARAAAADAGALVPSSGSHAVVGDGGAGTRILALQRSIGDAAVSRMFGQAGHAPAAVQHSAVHDVLRAPGQPLSAPVKEEMEARFGADFSQVRVHTNDAARASAAAVGARAYTSGNHVVIGPGAADRRTLTHELAHVIQQRQGPVSGTDDGSGLNLSDPSDRFERAAEATRLEPEVGVDLSTARVRWAHADALRSAALICARAHTSGRHVVIARKDMNTGVMKHEAIQVRQQGMGPVPGHDDGAGLRLSDPEDRCEREASAGQSRDVRHGSSAASDSLSPPVQRPAMGQSSKRYVVQRASQQQTHQALTGQGQADPALTEGLTAREGELSKTYGIRIGPPQRSAGPHFSDTMLDRIEAALKTLPPADLGPNAYLQAITLDEDAKSSASVYDPYTASIGMVRPEIPGTGVRLSQRLWAKLNRGNALQRWLMDLGAMSGYEGISAAASLGIGRRSRHVMAGVSDVLAHGNLIEWTVRHEVGHAADRLAEWSPMAGQERFGGWKIHHDVDVARAALTRAELIPEYEQAQNELSAILKAETVRQNSAGQKSNLHGFLTRLRPQSLDDSEFSRKSKMLIKFVRLAVAQPWTLDDGGAGTLDVNGRIYQLDHYDEWVSYFAAQRRYAVSNYQFSSPDEWFAEAYAAYHDPKQGVRDRLHPDAQAWFEARTRQGGQTSSPPASIPHEERGNGEQT